MTDATFRRFAAATLTRARAYVSEHMDEFEDWQVRRNAIRPDGAGRDRTDGSGGLPGAGDTLRHDHD